MPMYFYIMYFSSYNTCNQNLYTYMYLQTPKIQFKIMSLIIKKIMI